VPIWGITYRVTDHSNMHIRRPNRALTKVPIMTPAQAVSHDFLWQSSLAYHKQIRGGPLNIESQRASRPHDFVFACTSKPMLRDIHSLGGRITLVVENKVETRYCNQSAGRSQLSVEVFLDVRGSPNHFGRMKTAIMWYGLYGPRKRSKLGGQQKQRPKAYHFRLYVEMVKQQAGTAGQAVPERQRQRRSSSLKASRPYLNPTSIQHDLGRSLPRLQRALLYVNGSKEKGFGTALH